MRHPVGNYFDCQPLHIANGLVARRAVTHHTWKLQRFGDPASVGFAIQFDGQLHLSIIGRS